MALWKRAVDSVYGLLGSAPPSGVPIEDSMDEIRELMLDAIGPSGESRHVQLARRIRYAQDLQALWYLRGDVMAVLASLHGEAHARDVMLQISQEFDGLLPGGLASRPSPLA
jgi:hypothetical protein